MIGIFDSGSGGLTVLKAVKDTLPMADIVYFGDIKNAPYGEKSREELSRLTVNAMERLQREGATSIISACNSVSASMAISLFDTLSIAPDRLIEMVGPTVAYFRGSSERLLLCATHATVASGIYQNAFHMIGKEITAVPISYLAGAIEEGQRGVEITSLIEEAFVGIDLSQFDALLLACTHYPLALPEFSAVFPGFPIFNPAQEVARRVEERWWPRETGEGSIRFLITRDSEPFRTLVTDLFQNRRYEVEVVE